MNLRRNTSRRRVRIASIAFAAIAHALVLVALLVPSFVRHAPSPTVVIRVGPYYAPPAPKLGGGGDAGDVRAASVPERVRASAAPTPEFEKPAAIPDPIATPDPPDPKHTLSTSLAETSTTPATGLRGAPEGPGSPDGHPDSTCIENCEAGGLPGGPNPVPVDRLAVQPVPLHQPQPAYPASARVMGRTGTVTVEIVVGVDGRVQHARLVRGAPPFAGAALAAVRTWRYAPVLHEGKPILWKSEVTLRFELR